MYAFVYCALSKSVFTEMFSLTSALVFLGYFWKARVFRHYIQTVQLFGLQGFLFRSLL